MSIFRLKCSDVDTLVYAFRRASTLHSVFHQFHSKSTPTIRLGVLRESKSVWERRVPIVPDLIPPLLNAGAQVLMQPSSHRAISDDQFHKAGSIITEDLSSADIIIGIKEVPSSMLLPNKIYLFFSHTHKGQSKNMGMLKEIIEKKITLIDYELITDAHGKRTVAFGTYAGYAGMIDSLHILGRRMLALGYNSPFLQISMAHSYPSLNHARQSLDYLGKVIQKEGLPSCFAPFVVTFTGNGNVTSGAMSIFKHFPHQFLKVTDLPSLFRSKKHNPHCLYAVQAKHLDYLFDSEASFDEIKYRKEPHAFQSEFHSKIAPYTSLLVTGHFWNANYPRLLTSTQAAALSHHWKKHFRMLTIADISCDIEGGIEFSNKITNFEKPWIIYNSEDQVYHENIGGKGIPLMAIDILPSELPLEASNYFCEALTPILQNLLQGNINDQLKRAMITFKGKLEPQHAWLKDKLPSTNVQVKSPKQHVVILGSGYVVAPALDYLLKMENVRVTIASNNLKEAEKLVNGREKERIQIKEFDLDSSSNNCHDILKDADVVVSLLPANLHPVVAQSCIELGKSMVTASYVSPAMRSLDEKAKRANVILLNEIGLDPGLDHLSAKQCMDSISKQGGHLTGYASWCGGLPAPEHSDNPFGYKFSWSPLGALKAALNPSRFLLNGQVVEIPSKQILKHTKPFNVFPGFALESIPNRDALAYQSLYGLKDPLLTLFRGTLRFPSYCSILDAFIELNLMTEQPVSHPTSWPALICQQAKVHDISDLKLSQHVLNAMKWLGILEGTSMVKGSTILNALCDLLQSKLVFKEGERDMVLMYHSFSGTNASGKAIKRSSSLCVYGDPHGYSAMAKTVGLPVGIAVKLILEQKINDRGIVVPFTKEIYEPMLELLEKEGIKFVEKDGHDVQLQL